MPVDAPDQPSHQPEAQPDALVIALLGGFRVTVAGREVAEDEWRQRRAGDLVKLLALAAGHRAHAEQVTEALWPKAEAEAGARNLQQALHRARHVLEPGLRVGVSSRYLQRGADQIIRLVAPGGVWVDVEAFLAAWAAARRGGALADLVAAAERYTGDLLPGDVYADWTIRAREQLRQASMTLLAELAGRYEQTEQPTLAAETWARLVEADPAHEEARVALMRLHLRAGRRYHALRQYQQLRQALRTELATEPSAATQQLYEAIRTDSLPGDSGVRFTDLAADAGDRVVVVLPDPSPQPPLLERAGESGDPPRQGERIRERFATSFIGRAREIAEVARLLAAHRLVTLRGTGGSGKTRLAERVASGLRDGYADGMCWAELAPVADGRLVPQTVAAALGVREEHGRPLMETLVHELANREVLLVLDNCEQVVEGAAALAASLLAACPRVRILATSRRPLHLAKEQVWRVPEMASPDPDDLPPFEHLGEYDAIRLFAARAAARRPDFALTPRNATAVVGICARLDGLPLGIELAAARLRLLSVDELAARLDDALALLMNPDDEAAPRQRTLRAVLDWSYDLLDVREQVLFQRLAVFAGGWSLEAAEAVAAGEQIAAGQVIGLLEQLADASLVVVVERDGVTHHRLLEIVRRYAFERLETSGEREQVSRRHIEWYVRLVEAGEPLFVGGHLREWMERLDGERDNVRAALGWEEESAATALGLRLVGAVWRYWYHRGYFVEGRRWLEAFVAADGAADGGTAGLARIKALLGIGQITLIQGQLTRAQVASDEAMALARAGGFARELSIALSQRGGVAEYRGDYDEATRWQSESLAVARASDDTWRIAIALSNLADVARAQGRYAEAADWYGECLELARRIHDTRGIAMSLTNVGHMTLLHGDARGALGPLEESLALFRVLQDARGIGDALIPLGHAAFEVGDRAWADVCYVKGLEVFQASSNELGMAECLDGLAIYGARPPNIAVRLLGAAAALRETMGTPREPHRRESFARAMDDLRARLGERGYAAAWAVGRALPLERIIAEVSASAPREDPPGARGSAASSPRDDDPSAPLTPREREVAALVARGLKDREIASALGIAERTASTHVGHILGKLGLATREAIGGWWRREQGGLLPASPVTED